MKNKILLFVSIVMFISANTYSQGNIFTLSNGKKVEIAEKVSSERMCYGAALELCNNLGVGWRIPTAEEQKELSLNKDKIGGYVETEKNLYAEGYRSAWYYTSTTRYCQGQEKCVISICISDGSDGTAGTETTCFYWVRPIRDYNSSITNSSPNNSQTTANSTTKNTPATDRYYNSTSTSNVTANKTVSNYTFTKAPELKINYLDNRKMCCCCDQTYSQYKLRENIVTEEKIYYLTEKLADFHQQNGNALFSKTKNETQIQNDLSNLKSFLNTTYPGNQMFISFSVDFWYNSFMSGMMIFNQGQNKTKPGSTERFVQKYEIISPFCSLRCKNDVRCKSCH